LEDKIWEIRDPLYGFIDENKDIISRIIKEFGHLPAKSLELITTINYVINDLRKII
jgi:hypothetical protein